jgi:hypothetical protein
MPVYKEHHAKYSYSWADEKGTPVEVARRLVVEWNWSLDPEETPYIDSPAFIRSLGTLIYLRRKNISIQTISDNDTRGLDIDPLCLSCSKCR